MIHGNFDRSYSMAYLKQMFQVGYAYSHNICIRKESLKLVNDAKFLGMITDNKLKFENHVNDIIAKLSKVSGII